MMGPGMYGQQGAQGQPQDHPYEYPNQQEQQVAATMAHQQDQRGVSQLQGAVSAATGLGRPSMMQVSPGQGNSLTQPMNNLVGIGSRVLQGSQADLNKRGPVEFNHAISYVNKIKVSRWLVICCVVENCVTDAHIQNRFASHPEIYKQFLEILQTYQRESKPIQDVYGQVTHLFNSAPDLLEDFKQFLPESAAHARQQAARQAEEAIPLSNLRGDPNYPNAHVLQGSNRDVKMPPMGQFNVKDSGKEGKKRRGGPGAGGLGGSMSGPGADARVADSQGRVGAAQAGNANKVSSSHAAPSHPHSSE